MAHCFGLFNKRSRKRHDSRYSATGTNYGRFDRSTGSTLTGLSVPLELVSVVSAYTTRRAYTAEQTTRRPAVAPNSRTGFNSTAGVGGLSKGGGWYSRRRTSRGGCWSGATGWLGAECTLGGFFSPLLIAAFHPSYSTHRCVGSQGSFPLLLSGFAPLWPPHSLLILVLCPCPANWRCVTPLHWLTNAPRARDNYYFRRRRRIKISAITVDEPEPFNCFMILTMATSHGGPLDSQSDFN
jgi:hypothetical protein